MSETSAQRPRPNCPALIICQKIQATPQRLALRQTESTPILSSLKDRLFTWRDQLLPKHPMSQINQWLPDDWKRRNLAPSK